MASAYMINDWAVKRLIVLILSIPTFTNWRS